MEWEKFGAVSPEVIYQEYEKCGDPNHVPVIDEDGERVDYLPIIARALEMGYDSVMIDASRLDLDGNIAATREVVELARAKDVPVEAELGAVLGHSDRPDSSEASHRHWFFTAVPGSGNPRYRQNEHRNRSAPALGKNPGGRRSGKSRASPFLLSIIVAAIMLVADREDYPPGILTPPAWIHGTWTEQSISPQPTPTALVRSPSPEPPTMSSTARDPTASISMKISWPRCPTDPARCWSGQTSQVTGPPEFRKDVTGMISGLTLSTTRGDIAKGCLGGCGLLSEGQYRPSQIIMVSPAPRAPA